MKFVTPRRPRAADFDHSPMDQAIRRRHLVADVELRYGPLTCPSR
jgi:hypothetical protein